MKKKGYIFSLMIFLVFLAVFLAVIVTLKSVSVSHDATYEKTTIMKITNIARNIEGIKGDVLANGGTCNSISNALSSADFYHVTNTCSLASKTITLTSKSGDYSYRITIS